MYKAMYEILSTHAPLLALVSADHMYEAGSTEDRPIRPYLVIGWLPQLLKPGRKYTSPCEVRVHDERGSYARLRDVNDVVRTLLKGVEQYHGSDGWLVQCDYAGDSGELTDPDSGTNLMYTSWEVVGRRGA